MVMASGDAADGGVQGVRVDEWDGWAKRLERGVCLGLVEGEEAG